MATAPPASVQRVELVSSRAPATPKEQFLLMAELCDQYDIQKNDVYGDFTVTSANTDSSWIRSFEKAVSERLGTEDGLFVVSGTMGQAIASKIHQENAVKKRSDGSNTAFLKNFVCHYTSHLILHEQNSYPTLLGLNPIVVLPDSSSESPQLQPLRYRCVISRSVVEED
jgi:threonine aldolase